MPRIFLIFAMLMVLIAGCGGSEKPMRANDPNLGRAHVERAKFFWAHGEINKSIQEMEWAVAADPYNYKAAFNLGLMYLDQGQRVSARRVWENALEYMEDGVEREEYDNARAGADIRAALAELDKAEKPLGTPESILAAQGGQGGATSGAMAAAGTATGSVGATGQYGGAITTTNTTTSQVSRPGLPAGGTGGGSGGSQFTPKPYVANAQDGKPTARPRTSSASSSSSASRPRECPPCAPENTGKYAVQVSSNRELKNAQADANKLTSKGYMASIAANNLASGTWHVVWVGCCTSKEQAQKLAADLIKRGLAPKDARVTIPRK